ncbi:MAG: SAM-dependent methyltransferase [Saprospiraceae bacterium]|nr:MAG: uroporphyrin-III C/tetrapyrrole methyltransferase [Bacteroidetes bacterium OLB9]MCO6464863.1 SAM-dependent methyltransferase [Saprospiraceae bacterium]
MADYGVLYLIPCPISEGNITSLPSDTLKVLYNTSYFVVERAKTARRFIKSAGHPQPISNLMIYEITDDKAANETFLNQLFRGNNIGVISEAGCPGVADPGAEMVAWAHRHGIKVVPLIGPSSILLALMASGLSGQSFVFNGYLSNKKPELVQQLRQLESKASKLNQTQIWMETPYRNGFMIETCIQALQADTQLVIACDISNEEENIQSKPVKDWKQIKTDYYHKKPCIYLLG